MKLWIRSVMITEFRMTPDQADAVEGRLFSTGSYRYGVHTSGSDIDVVLVAPERGRITHEHFFTSFAERLRKEPWVSQLQLIKTAAVPLIAMKCDGVDIDLSFVAISRSQVPEILTDDILRDLDESGMKSCNGVRDAFAVIDKVPEQARGVFRQLLRFVKAWGKARGIYSFKLGYPSGIGWAILCAYIAQKYPNKNAAAMVERFFRVYSDWFKPDPHLTGIPNRHIALTESIIPATNIGKCWDPRNNAQDRAALFPVITPSNPYNNACFSVSLTTLRTLCAEFQRGRDILGQHMDGDPESLKEKFGSPFGVWAKLLEPVNLLDWRRFLHVSISCTDPLLYTRYADVVEARIAKLWSINRHTADTALESYPQVAIRVFSKRFEDPEDVEMIAAIEAAHRRGEKADRLAVKVPPGKRFTGHFLFGLEQNPKAVVPIHKKKIDLVPIVKNFHQIVMEMKGVFQPPATELPVVAISGHAQLPAFILAMYSAKRPREEPEQDSPAPQSTAPSFKGDTDEAKVDEPTPITQRPDVQTASPVTEPHAKPQRTPQNHRSTPHLDQLLGMDF
jgi:poly(A) polymerase